MMAELFLIKRALKDETSYHMGPIKPPPKIPEQQNFTMQRDMLASSPAKLTAKQRQDIMSRPDFTADRMVDLQKRDDNYAKAMSGMPLMQPTPTFQADPAITKEIQNRPLSAETQASIDSRMQQEKDFWGNRMRTAGKGVTGMTVNPQSASAQIKPKTTAEIAAGRQQAQNQKALTSYERDALSSGQSWKNVRENMNMMQYGGQEGYAQHLNQERQRQAVAAKPAPAAPKDQFAGRRMTLGSRVKGLARMAGGVPDRLHQRWTANLKQKPS